MPQRVVPAEVTLAAVLARSSKALVALGGVRAYPNGFEFTVTALLRDPVHYRLTSAIIDPGDAETLGRPGLLLRIEVAFADGAVTTNAAPGSPGHSPADRVFLFSGGGGANGCRFERRFWTAPLPPEGPLWVICEWPEFDIPDVRHEIDARLIREAARGAIAPWPDGASR